MSDSDSDADIGSRIVEETSGIVETSVQRGTTSFGGVCAVVSKYKPVGRAFIARADTLLVRRFVDTVCCLCARVPQKGD